MQLLDPLTWLQFDIHWNFYSGMNMDHDGVNRPAVANELTCGFGLWSVLSWICFWGLSKSPVLPSLLLLFLILNFCCLLSFGANQQHSGVYLSLPDLWNELSTWADDSYWPTAAAGTWWRSHWGCPRGLSIPQVLLLMVVQHARDCCISHTAFLFYFSWCFSSLPLSLHRLYS